MESMITRVSGQRSRMSRVAPVLREADHFHFGLRGHEVPQAFGDDGVIVGNKDADRHRYGVPIAISVPPPGLGRTTKLAPIACARSRMVIMPSRGRCSRS